MVYVCYLCANPELDPSLACLPVDLLVLQVWLLPLAVVLVGEGHNICLVALLACRDNTRVPLGVTELTWGLLHHAGLLWYQRWGALSFPGLLC